ncbi:MAG: DUF1800 family protein [Pseudomonadota bacterium]
MALEGAIAATRFGLGARPGEIKAASSDPRGWLEAQLTQAAFSSFPSAGLSSAKQGLETFFRYTQARSARGRTSEAADIDPEQAKKLVREVRLNLRAEVQARTGFGALTPHSFHERLTRFWSNHFTVAARSPQTVAVAGAYEREAIRPNILGSFTELALAAITHPGLLVYLDNWQSIGPSTRPARRRGRGLNENLAREVLELHTVTPASGYTQTDVTEFAKALTGWTVGNRRLGSDRKGETIFVSQIHEPGVRTILGKRYSEDGKDQAVSIIRDLCAHPETAKSVARKMATHFVSDMPPDALIERLETAFRRSNGDLPTLYAALIDAPEAWDGDPQKIKTPDELLTSSARAIGIDAVFAGDPRAVLESFAQIPFTALSPEGWPDEADAWLGSDALMKRIEWAGQVARRSPTLDARKLMDDALGPLASDATRTAVARAESGEQAIVLAVMSPEFQRR